MSNFCRTFAEEFRKNLKATSQPILNDFSIFQYYGKKDDL